MPLPTQAELLERLRAVYEQRDGRHLSDEALAGRLDIRLSTLNRWKRQSTQQFEEMIRLLDEAGWLSVSQPDPAATAGDDPLAQALEEIAGVLRRLVTHESKRERRPAAASSRPKRKKSA